MSTAPPRAAPACLALALVSCGGNGDESDVQTFTNAVSGKTIAVSEDEMFRVALEANQTTPYRWHLSKIPDPAIVGLVSSEYEADPNAEELVGSGGTSIWTFEAKGLGTTTIGLVYVEIGKKVPGRADFSVTVDVAAR